MPAKTTGAMFVGRCPICGDELTIGWGKPGVTAQAIANVAKLKMPAKDGGNMLRGPISCSDGNLTASLDLVTGLATFAWTDPAGEPIVSNMNLH